MTAFDCFKCHSKCKAVCCNVCPIEKEIYERNLDKRLRSIEKLSSLGAHVIPITSDGKCVFLKDDLTCNIYDDRPFLCKKFGDETHLMMTCAYQDKNGRHRSRQEKRALERKMEKKQEYTLNYLLSMMEEM